MRNIIEMQQKVVPDLLEVLRERLEILRQLQHLQPIGRRALARSLQMTERILRGEVETLKKQGLIDFLPSGMMITNEGRKILDMLFPILHQMDHLSELEGKLAKLISLRQVLIVQGDSSTNEQVKKEMGRMAGFYLKNNIRKQDKIAVTGGTSMAAVAEMLYIEEEFPDVTFYPARGGLGEHVDIQANTVAAKLAEKLGARYVMLHVPDHLREETYRTLIEEPHVRERVEEIRSARLVFHGIGNALSMAVRRGADEEIIQLLQQKKAVGEAFGYYFDQEGQEVYHMPTMGLRLEDLKNKECVAVAGGSDKAEAIVALAKSGIFQVLITDEGAAREILDRIHYN